MDMDQKFDMTKQGHMYVHTYQSSHMHTHTSIYGQGFHFPLEEGGGGGGGGPSYYLSLKW